MDTHICIHIRTPSLSPTSILLRLDFQPYLEEFNLIFKNLFLRKHFWKAYKPWKMKTYNNNKIAKYSEYNIN